MLGLGVARNMTAEHAYVPTSHHITVFRLMMVGYDGGAAVHALVNTMSVESMDTRASTQKLLVWLTMTLPLLSRAGASQHMLLTAFVTSTTTTNFVVRAGGGPLIA